MEALTLCVLLDAGDNVCVAAVPLAAGQLLAVGGRTVTTTEPIKQGHKIATAAIAQGAPIVKYGQTIGFADGDIAAGAWVHTHNVAVKLFDRDYAFCANVPADPQPLAGHTFQGTAGPTAKPARGITSPFCRT